MTIDEAIKHCEEVAQENEKQFDGCPMKYEGAYANNGTTACKCAKEHRQLAEWLRDYKRLLEQEPCEDAISRQAVLEVQAKYAEYVGATKFWQMRDDIKELPPVTPQPQPKTGYWIGIDEEPHADWECDNCGFVIWADENIEKFHYCPNCGAKMIEPQESEDVE